MYSVNFVSLAVWNEFVLGVVYAVWSVVWKSISCVKTSGS